MRIKRIVASCRSRGVASCWLLVASKYCFSATITSNQQPATSNSSTATITSNQQLATSNSTSGFTLLEAMVATAIMGIGFVGVYTLAVVSEVTLHRAESKQKMQMQANQILEVIENDIANIDQYTMNLTTCTPPSQTNTYLVRGYEWCQRLSGEVGAASGDTRSITVTTMADGSRAVGIVLECQSGAVQVVMKRVYSLG